MANKIPNLTESAIPKDITKNVVNGRVSDCKMLKVRSKPSTKPETEIVAFIDEGTEVEIFKDRSTKDFYYVKSDKFNGYCMKQFIAVTM